MTTSKNFILVPLAGPIRKASYDNRPLEIAIDTSEIETFCEREQFQDKTDVRLKSGRSIEIELNYKEFIRRLEKI